MNSLDKQEYILFVNQNKDIVPLYFHPEWLNAVCGNLWIALVYKNKSNMVEAIMPLPYKKKFGKVVFVMPKQTQFLGVWYDLKKNVLNHKRFSFEQKVIDYFIKRIPKFLMFKIRFSPNFINSQPFNWSGFKQTNQYTYQLRNINNHVELFESFNNTLRRNIRKAKKIVKIEETEDLKTFYEINSLTFKRQGVDIKYSFELVNKIDEYLKNIDRRKILIAKDDKANIHAVLYMIFDKDIAYYLWGGANPEFRSSQAQNYLLWEAIKLASERVTVFDFEGSMIQNVALVYRKFNSIITPYYRISKVKNLLLNIREA